MTCEHKNIMVKVSTEELQEIAELFQRMKKSPAILDDMQQRGISDVYEYMKTIIVEVGSKTVDAEFLDNWLSHTPEENRDWLYMMLEGH